ncbi:MlaD family protein [uncultured Chitinophaga sp.]|jgi:ABC-type transport system involved in resistance to organic solvents, periplasmic component|uniref:MlaD family protein n=1 Tax=uncultured Chitinophaga sp. TaxID=339340 RepID=UPI002602CFFF|nr:MlaD family protein [uncultured Chitinophaga sp.]
MQTRTKTRTVVVGIFIFVGLVIFCLAVLVLGGQKKAFMPSVQVRAMFQDVGGLAKGNNVWYSGVKVGSIKKITFLEPHKIEVLINIDRSYVGFIRKDVRAKVSSDGLIGNKIIALNGGNPQSPVIEDGDEVAVETSISSDELMNTLQVNNKNLVDITGNLKEITNTIAAGKGNIGKLLKDTTVYDRLERTLASLQQTSANAQRLTNNLSAYSAKLQTEGVLANELVTDTMVFSRLRSTVSNMEQAAQSANETVKNLQGVSANVNKQLSNPQSAAGVLLNDPQTAQHLKQTIINLDSSTGRLNQNMEALKHNFLFRGYFRRQEKAAKKAAEQQQKELERQQKEAEKARQQ